MNRAVMRQIRTSAILMLLVAGCIVGSVYFHFHPIYWQEVQGETTEILLPKTTYVPYAKADNAEDLQIRKQMVAQSEEEPQLVATTQQTERMRFFTIKRATIFTFSGLGNSTELTSVLSALRDTGSYATFFVTLEELDQVPDQVRSILSDGHEIAISINPGQYTTVPKILQYMDSWNKRLWEAYDAYGAPYIRPTYGYASKVLCQAADTSGYEVLGQMVEAVPESVTRETDAYSILSKVIRENDGKLQRGEIVHFQMNLLQHSDTVLGDLVRLMIRNKGVYPILSAGMVAADKDALYEYPVPDNRILPEVKDVIHPGYLDGRTDKEIFETIRDGYIGISWVNDRYFLPGFTSSEISQLDASGLIRNDQNMVFLTFDDWGTDETVDRLLTVLRKHNAKATFFVKSQYVRYNPNLLRAIAAEGHTIGDHTFTHMPLSNERNATSYTDLTDTQVTALQADMVKSHETMQQIIGDMRDASGRPSLSRLFRPPTLAVSRNGLFSVFDSGYTKSVSGSYTTQDYNASSPEKLATTLKRRLRSGAVLIMHFSDNAVYTAQALDICLSELENESVNLLFVGLNYAF